MGDVAIAIKIKLSIFNKKSIGSCQGCCGSKKNGNKFESADEKPSKLLNFTQSVKDEMEASVLVGKSINLQKTRELAYHRDIMGLNKEILNIAKQTNFENLDPFQQECRS